MRVLDGPDRFDKTLHKHYHVKCSCCGKVVDTGYTCHDDLEGIAENGCDFKITGHEIIFEGICPDCQVNNN